ncbi:TatD family deoxyribonuclease [Helicobacter aurati]|uniref:TatD family deoxyribonuclease n=1 Tax=Helicobacter aurati TaxID=137778 RepID=A0A3D8J750_9HELI|nr:TatD family hydrolase [Helicobacter aurati]RDU73110.1 TatD family deoxyribonuclease [Helicobacter aurati]
MNAMIDTHIHLDSKDFHNDLEQVITESQNAHVSHFLIPGASLETLQKAIDIAANYPKIFLAAGIHPYHTDEMILRIKVQNLSYLLSLFTHTNEKDKGVSLECFVDSLLESWAQWIELMDSHAIIWQQDCLRQFERMFKLESCKAVGECGLDFFRLNVNDLSLEQIALEVLLQFLCFCKQITFALQNNLPLILHVRDSKQHFAASLCTLKILQFYKDKAKSLYGTQLRGVFHCYNAHDSLLTMSEYFYYGIGGIITFKNAKEIAEILPSIPLERILLETDAPYLAPTPHRGKRNESKFLPLIVDKISEILAIPANEIQALTTNNAKKLFALQ